MQLGDGGEGAGVDTLISHSSMSVELSLHTHQRFGASVLLSPKGHVCFNDMMSFGTGRTPAIRVWRLAALAQYLRAVLPRIE